MFSRKLKFSCILLLIAGLISCAPYAQSSVPTIDPTAQWETAVAIAATTLAALQSTGNDTPTPTQTGELSSTSTPSLTPLPPSQPTLQGLYLQVSDDTNCRTGPDIAYDRLGLVKVGQSAQIIGRDSLNEYYYVRLPDNPSIYCWMLGYYATVYGNIYSAPVFTAQPSPTPGASSTPTVTSTPAINFTATYVGKDNCVGWFLKINIVNTGSIILQSVRLVTKDITTSNTYTATYDVFEDWIGCTVSAAQNDLITGESEKTNTGAYFPADPAGHNIEVTIRACSENGLAGTCLTKIINFVP